MIDLISFLRGEGPDINGRTLSSLNDSCDDELEQSHDFIQWMFPSDIPSKHNDYAPVLTKEQIEMIRNDDLIKEWIRMSLLRMLYFYKGSWWITRRNHNFLRITRILRCLWLSGLKWEYDKLQIVLDRIYNKHSDIIGSVTYTYWKNANDNDFFQNRY